ncbi:MAG: Rap1a/Tai family immunity protein [Candidatus Sulfotelmatobacter sp.]|jgi:hypothetical protein
MMRYLLLACLLPLALVASANSEEDYNFTSSGNDFLRLCDVNEEHATTMTGACRGYVAGVIDGFDGAFILGQTSRHEPPKGLFCTPAESTLGQKYRVVVKFMKDHPEKDHLPASALILEAILGAFPCPQAKTPEVPPPNK